MKRYIEWEEFEQTFPIRLNAQQKSAVQSVNGPVLLLAVPGSGKTTVLVTRLGYMIYCKGIDPEKILTVTYTVAATKDMSRVQFARRGQNIQRQDKILLSQFPVYGRSGKDNAPHRFRLQRIRHTTAESREYHRSG